MLNIAPYLAQKRHGWNLPNEYLSPEDSEAIGSIASREFVFNDVHSIHSLWEESQLPVGWLSLHASEAAQLFENAPSDREIPAGRSFIRCVSTGKDSRYLLYPDANTGIPFQAWFVPILSPDRSISLHS